MSVVKEYIYTPREYLAYGDKRIRNIPLINTSLKELAECGWVLSVLARWIPGYGHTKVKYNFSDPDGKGNPYIVFRLWTKGNLLFSQNFIQVLIERDLTPNFSKPASFSLLPVDPVMASNVIETKEETELEYLMRTNKQKLDNLPRKYLVGNASENRSDYTPVSRSKIRVSS